MAATDQKFLILHALRLKGAADHATVDRVIRHGPNPVPDIVAILRELEASGSVRRRTRGDDTSWMLTPDGRDRHQKLVDRERTDEIAKRLKDSYYGFLAINEEVKSVCSDWQMTSPDDSAARFEKIADLEDLHAEATEALQAATDVLPRFCIHPERLGIALDHLTEGREAYFTSPLVDSYHTVWFECHEDYLLSLGEERTE